MRLRRLWRTTAAWAAAAASCGLTTSAEAETVYFQHEDARFLHRYQRNGGAAVVPEGVPAAQALPLVVFLHGTNPTSEPHLWMGGGSKDLRPLATRPYRSLIVTANASPGSAP